MQALDLRDDLTCLRLIEDNFKPAPLDYLSATGPPVRCTAPAPSLQAGIRGFSGWAGTGDFGPTIIPAGPSG